MIIEFELQGSKGLHKGIFETTGFWLRYEEQKDDHTGEVEYYKLFSHFSFSYAHEKKEIFDLVYSRLISVFRGANNVEIDGVGYIRKISK